jgi:ABC-type transport system substrate-binding protein
MSKSARIIGLIALIVAASAALLWFLLPNRDRVDRPDELTLRMDSFAVNLFPPTLAEINSRRIGTLLHSPLVRMRDDGSLSAGVASAWVDNGLVWRFRIRPGARFSDGRPVTAADASASICRSMQPGTSWAWSLASIAQTKQGSVVRCDGLTVAGDELIIRQTIDVPWFEQAITGPAGWILPEDASARASYGNVPGAGRYKVEAVVPDSHVLLTAVDPRAGLPPIRFRYIADDSQAAALLRSGTLSSLYLQSPLLKSAVGAGGNRYHLVTRSFDRVRVLIINERRLAQRGFSSDQIRTFRDALDSGVDRQRLESISAGVAVGDARPLPIFGSLKRSPPPASATAALPATRLTILSEPDSFSDQIAAALPSSVGPVRLEPRALEKGALIGALVEGNFDIVSIVLEATMHSPKFWSSFFEPEGAFVAFGMPIAGAGDIDFTQPDAVSRLDALLTARSNWVVLLREQRVDAVSDSLVGLAFTPSGQDDLAEITLRPPTD